MPTRGFSDAVFAIALTLLVVEIKVPGSPEGAHGYSDLAKSMGEQRREYLALVLCYVVIGAYLSATPLFGSHLCEE